MFGRRRRPQMMASVKPLPVDTGHPNQYRGPRANYSVCFPPFGVACRAAHPPSPPLKRRVRTYPANSCSSFLQHGAVSVRNRAHQTAHSHGVRCDFGAKCSRSYHECIIKFIYKCILHSSRMKEIFGVHLRQLCYKCLRIMHIPFCRVWLLLTS